MLNFVWLAQICTFFELRISMTSHYPTAGASKIPQGEAFRKLDNLAMVPAALPFTLLTALLAFGYSDEEENVTKLLGAIAEDGVVAFDDPATGHRTTIAAL